MKARGNFYVLITVMVIMAFVIVWSLVVMKSLALRLLPLVFGSVVFVLTAIGIWRETVEDKKQTTAPESKIEANKEAYEDWSGQLLNGAWILGFLIGNFVLGFIVALPLFILFYMKWLGTRWTVAIIFAILTTAFIYAIFELVLRVDLYKGLLLTWLGY